MDSGALERSFSEPHDISVVDPDTLANRTGLYRLGSPLCGPGSLPLVGAHASGALPKGMKDFSTIDWMLDGHKERTVRKLLKMHRNDNMRTRLGFLYFSGQAWVLVLIIGVLMGVLTGILDKLSIWLSGLRSGYCSYSYTTDMTVCCHQSNALGMCDAWIPWSAHFNFTSDAASWWIDYVIYICWSVAFSLPAAYLVKTVAPYAKGMGVPELKSMLSGFLLHKFLGGTTLFIKCLGMPLVVASGLVLGKEGAYIHAACCIANIVARLFPKFANQSKLREALSSAAAAGVSCAFGAPIGGVLFSLEEVSYYFPHKTMWRAMFCSLAAVAVMSTMNAYGTSKLVLFEVTSEGTWTYYEVPLWGLVGVIGGITGAFIVKFNKRWTLIRMHTAVRFWPITEVVILTLITAIFSYPDAISLRLDAGRITGLLFSHCDPHLAQSDEICAIDASNVIFWGLIFAGLVRMVLVVFTYGSPVPGGVFIPAMFIGASFGRALGIIVNRLLATRADNPCGPMCVDASLYAVIGAASVLAGTLRMTVAVVVIVFELTGGVGYLIPIMIAVMVSKAVADVMGKTSLFDMSIALEEYPFLDQKAESYDYSSCASDVIRSRMIDVITDEGNTVTSLRDYLGRSEAKGFPVVDAADVTLVVGYVSRFELEYVLNLADASPNCTPESPVIFTSKLPNTERGVLPFIDVRPWMDPTPVSVTHTTPFDTLADMFIKCGLRYVLVMRYGRLCGLITRKDILRHIAEHKGHEQPLYELPSVE